MMAAGGHGRGAKFNEAGCSKDDITKALMNHASGV